MYIKKTNHRIIQILDIQIFILAMLEFPRFDKFKEKMHLILNSFSITTLKS